MNFTVMNNSINFSNEFIELNKLRGTFLEYAFESVKEFTDKYNEKFDDISKLSEDGEAFGYEFLDRYLSKAIDVIKEFEVSSVDADMFKEKYYYGRYCTWIAEFDKVNEEYLLSKDDSIDIEVFRNKLNEKRAIWKTDDIEVNKIIEVNLKVGSLKINSKIVSNNFTIEMKDIITSGSELEDFNENEFLKILEKLKYAMLESIFNIHFSVIDVLRDNGVKAVADYSNFSEFDKANELLETLTNKEITKEEDDDGEIIKIKEIIEMNPYNEEIYEFLINKYGDKDNEVEDLGKYLGYCNIGQYKCTKLDEYYKNLPLETNDEIESAKEKIIDFAKNLKIEDYSKYIDELEEKLKVNNSKVEINTETDIEIKKEIINETKVDTEVKDDKQTNLDKEKKIRICAIAAVICVIVAYLGMSLYFKDHFYFGTTIDNVSVSGKTVQNVYEEVSSNATEYNLELKLRGEATGEIKGTDIGLEYDFQEEIKKLKDSQNPFGWISGLFNNKEYTLSEGILYNEDLLKESINKLPCFDEKSVVEPKNPEIKYVKNSYKIVNEVQGNKVNLEKLTEKVVNAIKNKETNIDIEEAECYEKPKYTVESQEVINAKTEMDKYVASTINYTVSGHKQVINGDLINTWVVLDEDFNVKFKDDQVKKYVDTLGTKYDKTGNVRQFGGIKFSTSTEITTIDRNTEVPAIIELVKKGESANREAKFITTAVGSGVVNTFVEVNITQQHIWFYKNGKLITEGPIVSGNISKGHNTRIGVFKLYGKQRNTVLKGEDYAVPVDFWMPFDGGIGMHDASWRGQFGGDIYKTNGSHGCVNTLYPVAQAIYNNINVGDYVICHY